MGKINEEVLKIAEYNPHVNGLVQAYLNSTMGKTELYVRIIKELDSVYKHQSRKIDELLEDE